MSRLMLLTTVGVAVGSGAPPDPPDPPDEPQTTWPETDDPVLESMRPTGRLLGTLTVDPAFPESETNFHTISDAMDVAKAMQEANAQGTGLAFLGGYGPDYRVDIIIATGDYDEFFGTGAWINLVGATGDPADVVVHSDVDSGGIMHTFGGIFAEGMTFWSQDNGGGPTSGPKYPWHIGGGGTQVAANCVFLDENVSGGSGTLGMDGGDGSFTLFYGCTITGPGMNLHGQTDPTEPLTVVWVNCVVDDGDVSYGQLDSGIVTDEVWAIDTTDGVTPVTVSTSGTVTEHTSGTWPVPVGGVSPRDSDYHYPSAIGTAHTETIGAGDQAAFSPPAGRKYWVPLTVAQALNGRWHSVVAASAGGVVGVRMQRRSFGTGPEDEPTQTLGTLASGVNETEFYYRATFYPGDAAKEIAYMEVSIDSGTPSLMGSLTAAAGAYYSDDDGATFHAVAGGSRVPVVRIRSAS